MKMPSVRQHWHKLTNTNHLCQCIDVILRSYGQLMLQTNSLSGLIFLVGVLLGGHSAG
ncbi:MULTISPECIES: urea transporter [Snodgrassella]|uniref:urea transporter n=1 Tax=Snodgrassella TaxID=1193515 RepID=UPI001183C3F1|nr:MULTISPECIES: urea transporter [Snodgrassella]NUE66296.1 urea transporter [Snodgrassella sp. ESL0253]